jgi:bacterioferritin-associated ferredoxin
LTIIRILVHLQIMIVCVCRSLNCAKVRDAIASGARTPAQVHAHHATTINCGKCGPSICAMLRERGAAREHRPQPLLAAE